MSMFTQSSESISRIPNQSLRSTETQFHRIRNHGNQQAIRGPKQHERTFHEQSRKQTTCKFVFGRTNDEQANDGKQFHGNPRELSQQCRNFWPNQPKHAERGHFWQHHEQYVI